MALDDTNLPRTNPNDKTPPAVTVRRLKRQVGIFQGTGKLPFVPSDEFLRKAHAIKSYLLAGTSVLHGDQIDFVMEALQTPDTVDYENLTPEQKDLERRYINAQIVELHRLKEGQR